MIIKTNIKLYFLNKLRVMLTVVVIIFHISIAYGRMGEWYYYEPINELSYSFYLQFLMQYAKLFLWDYFS